MVAAKHRLDSTSRCLLICLSHCVGHAWSQVPAICPSYQSSLADGSCSCSPGHEHAPGRGSGLSCVPCQPGHFKSGTGTQKCEPCAAGYFLASEGGEACLPCHPSTYQDAAGATACTLCSARTNSTAGAVSCGLCARGFYRKDVSVVASEMTCKVCDERVDCPSNSTVATLVLHRGYWRLSNASTELQVCRQSAETCMQFPTHFSYTDAILSNHLRMVHYILSSASCRSLPALTSSNESNGTAFPCKGPVACAYNQQTSVTCGCT